MDNFEYLNQISQSNRPVKRSLKPSGPKTSLIIKLSVAGVLLFFLLMAFGSLLGNLGGKETELTKQVYTRTTNLNTVLNTYNRDLKSSQLRAIGASLSAILTNASNQLSAYIVSNSKGDKKALVLDEKTAASEASILEELNTSLTNAKLNGVLDRYYDNQIGLQVSLLLSQTSALLARTKDPNLIAIISTLHSSLETIHQSIEAYANTN